MWGITAHEIDDSTVMTLKSEVYDFGAACICVHELFTGKL